MYRFRHLQVLNIPQHFSTPATAITQQDTRASNIHTEQVIKPVS